MMDVEPEEDPPVVVLVHGPRGVGKSTLIRALVKHYTHQSLGEVQNSSTRPTTACNCVDAGFAARRHMFMSVALLQQVQGPVTIVAGKRRRLTFVECPQVSKQSLWRQFRKRFRNNCSRVAVTPAGLYLILIGVAAAVSSTVSAQCAWCNRLVEPIQFFLMHTVVCRTCTA